MHASALFTLAVAMTASASPTGMRRVNRRAPSAVDVKNGNAAIAQNKQFAGIKAGSACTAGQNACAGDQFAQCVGDKYVAQPCAASLVCAALPNIGSEGTSIACTTRSDRDARIAATGAGGKAAAPPAAPPAKPAAPPAKSPAAPPAKPAAPPAKPPAAPPAKPNAPAKPPAAPPAGNNAGGGAAAGGDLQKSFTLDPSVVQKGFLNNGQNPPVEGQFPSLTSENNFINFCAQTLPKTPLTNGQQVTTGSCNGAPIGLIPSTAKMPSGKFSFPKNLDTIPFNKTFTIQYTLKNIDAGHFTNAKENYYAAPQQLNDQGTIIGHTHVVIEKIQSLTTTEVTDPNVFFFFKGINTGLVDGKVSTEVTGGCPPGVYRLCSQNAAMNHQPVIVPIAQHGNLDDCVYFTSK
ncbi:hypothetical protein C8R43DRAFT_1078355 [Mycena crocata]|nr:hypothetical protein C8R43DRAFT_1078355 [Mycena crocata]